jgi:NAD(P)-dependent dehydrogenase (short-subunit alcohol dehydrogenase family)
MSNAHRSHQPVAVVTGGSRGLGFALTRSLAERGWAVVIDARRTGELEAATAELRAHGHVVAVAGDVTDNHHRAALAAAARELGAVRLVVNNASTLGASPLPSLRAIDPDVLRHIYDVNVVAPIALVQALDDQLAEGATIINVSSDAGVEAYEGWGGYGSSKAALDHLTRVLAVERPDLRVLAVDPGDMRTEMHQAAFPGEDISDRALPDTSVPGLLALIESTPPSGQRFVARDVVVPEGAAS